MRTAQDILLITDDTLLARALQATLETHNREARLCADFADLEATLAVQGALAVLVDIDPHAERTLRQIEPIIARFPDTRFIALAEETSSELLLSAMNVGLRHVLAKATLRQELPAVLDRIAAGVSGGAQQQGAVVTVLSAGGGCGATTVAVNMASELPRGEKDPALIVDLDSAYGAVATYLGVKGDYSLADVLARPQERIDPQLITSSALKFNDRLHALINPVSVNFESPAVLRYEQLATALDACRQAYRWTVVDAPRLPIDVAAQLVRASKLTLIVAQLSVKDVRGARSIHRALIDRGAAPQALRFVINRYHSRRCAITLDDAQRALGDHAIELVKNDFGSATESVNMGQPLAQVAPRSVTRRDIQTLAQSIASLNGHGHTLAPLKIKGRG